MFHFKNFSVEDSKAAMKIGTDGVLLGAWLSLDHQPNSVLDVGTGTGIIALQLAQRSTSQTIDAIEIDDNAFEQAVDNFEQSPWADRLYCYHASFLEFVDAFQTDDPYDIIVCNPPFFNDTKTTPTPREMARFQEALPFEHLLFGASKLLSKTGEFSVILPFSETEQFIKLANTFKLNLQRQTNVKGHNTAPIKRSLLSFSFKTALVKVEELTIETKRHHYTQDYITLVKDFYLKM